jgi:hypothetical protein
MPLAPTDAVRDADLVARLLQRLAEDLAILLGQELAFGTPAVERASTRPAGRGRIHVSFRLVFAHEDGTERHGALLVPLPEAITMAALLQMASEDSLPALRERSELDPAQKEALLELATMMADSGRSALAQLGLAGWTLRSGGCQGVRADVRPALPYEEGSPLVVGRVQASIGSFPPFELVVMLPPLG